MKQVLQVCHGYAPPFVDVARQYAVLFRDTEYRVTTVYLTGKTDEKIREESSADEVIFLENSSRELRGLKLKQIRQLKAIAQPRAFDFAIAHRFKSIYVSCHIKGLAVIGVHHAFGDYKRLSRRVFAYLQKKRLFLLGVSNAIRDDLRGSLAHFPEQQIQTLYNRIDLEALRGRHLDRGAAKKALGLKEDCFYYVNVGRLHPDKDQRTLIKAFSKVASQADDARLLIYGKGRLEEDLRQLLSELNLETKVAIGSRAYISHYMKAFDCFVLSSDHEPFGMVLLEAMAAELPVVSTREGGAGEIVGDSGLLFERGDVDGLATHMQSIREMKVSEYQQLRNRMESRIVDAFTDQVAAVAFMRLPFVGQIIGPGQSGR